MDPTACVKRLLAAFIDGDVNEWNDAAADYAAWRRAGGFLAEVQHVTGKSGKVTGAAEFGLLRLDVDGKTYDVECRNVTVP